MTDSELIKKFNPEHASALTKADLVIMQNLTDAQIGVLAKAYPNTPNRKHYLVLYDKKVAENKQLYNLSSWVKLFNLRTGNNLKNWIPWSFWSIFQPDRTQKPSRQTGTHTAVASARRVVDLSATEAAGELKKATQDRQAFKGGNAQKTAAPTDAKPPVKKAAVPKKTAAPKTEKPAVQQGEGQGGGVPDDQQEQDI